MVAMVHPVPAHVRHLELVALRIAQVAGEAHDLAAQDTQARHIALAAVFEQHLQADADAEERLVARGFQHGIAQPRASSSRMQSGIAPWPGNTTRPAPAITRASSLTTTLASGATLRKACSTERKLPIPDRKS